jgi:transcriptional regulator with XRE-family HTH domain
MVQSSSMTGKEFRRKRGHLGLTQVQLAAQLGVTGTAVARWERAERKISEPVARLLTLLCKLNRSPRRHP